MNAMFQDSSGFPVPPMQGWAPIVVRRQQIEAQIERLAELPPPAHGIRAVRIIHPQAPNPGQGLAPSIACSVQVLKPGESTSPMRHNASEVSICIRGRGQVTIAQERFSVDRFDVWNTPAMHPFVYRNDGEDLFARLTYSNAALLEALRVHHVEHLDASGKVVQGPEARGDGGATHKAPRSLPPPIFLDGGGQLLTYEHLISPEVVKNTALCWRWRDVLAHSERVFAGDALKNMGRRGLFMLYNPATGRLLGATHSFFATLGFMPGDVLDFPHRHSSSAINYCLRGDQVSEVNGERILWGEGDIAYTAPGWSAHANGSLTGGISLTLQDHPLQMGLESLIWQEGEGKPIRLLGAEPGFVSDDSIRLRGAG